jgi:hypothetical protein
VRRKRRLRPPWRNLLGGKPIERQYFYFNEKRDIGEDHLRLMQHIRMRLLMDHYKIQGAVEAYPIKGVGAATWLPWFELALAIASELDDSLKINDASLPGKTAPRWRGIEGQILLSLVDVWKKLRPKRPVRWCLQQMQKIDPNGFGRTPLDQLEVRYYEATRRDTTKAVPNKGRAS